MDKLDENYRSHTQLVFNFELYCKCRRRTGAVRITRTGRRSCLTFSSRPRTSAIGSTPRLGMSGIMSVGSKTSLWAHLSVRLSVGLSVKIFKKGGKFSMLLSDSLFEYTCHEDRFYWRALNLNIYIFLQAKDLTTTVEELRTAAEATSRETALMQAKY